MYTGTAEKVLVAMDQYDLKEERPGRYRSNSPMRPGSNSHGFTLVIHDSEHGAFFDHVSNEAGSLYLLAKELGIETPENTAPANTKRIYTGIDDYATAHGITADDLRSAGWHETIYQNRSALAFKTATGTRWRFLDGEKPYYKGEKGYQRCWYGLTPSLAKVLGNGKALVITNGEISTVAARQYGVGSACVTGGEKAIPPDLIEELKVFLGGTNEEHVPPIIVAFDCDDTGKHAARLVTKQLQAAGFTARAVDLGLGGKGDLADFCMLHGKDTSRALNQLPTMALDVQLHDSDVRRWVVIHASELQNLPPVEWIIPGEIPERAIVVLFGPSGSGKSFLSLDYALRIAQSKTVVYMAAEGEYGYAQRVGAWKTHHKKGEGKLYMCLGAVQLMETDDLGSFLEVIKPLQPSLVIVDTLARTMDGRDENSTRDMGLFVRSVEDIKRELDCSVLMVHHTNKGGISERGSSSLRGASDVMIKVQASDDLIKVECSKTKDAQPFPTRYMRLLPVGASVVMVPDENVIQTTDDPLTNHQMEVLRKLMEEESGLSRADLSQLLGIPYHSLQRVLTRLKKLQYVETSGWGAPYAITQNGIDRLDRVDRPFPESLNTNVEKTTDQPDQLDQLGENQTELIDQLPAPDAKNAKSEGDQSATEPQLIDQPDQLRLIGSMAYESYEVGP